MAEKNLAKIAYQTLQQGKSLAGFAHKEFSTKLMELVVPEALPKTSPVTKELLMELQRSIKELEKIDWQEAEEGIYPKTQLFEAPWIDWITKYPLIWLDMPSIWARRRKKITSDFPKRINLESYPDYYVQNFHHQTDGYLSDHSAKLYDIQVEILFNGTADSMRRRVIAPIKQGISKFKTEGSSNLKILDVATGTGRTIQQLRSAINGVDFSGLDLSSSYLKQASKYLNNRAGDIVQLAKGNAEEIPFPENSFHAISCVFLFHELPRSARDNVIKECFRVLKPGGVFVIADSIQLNDSPKFKLVMENFHKFFHEPYYRDYINDDIDARLNLSGFKSVKAKSFFMTRVWQSYKPIN